MTTALSLMYALCSPHILYSPQDRMPWYTSDIPNLSGKVVLITGGTQGKGFEIAKALAYARARVLILARDEDRPDIALLQIKRHCRVHEKFVPDLEFIQCDLSSLSDVRRVGDELYERESRLDMVICDAGVGIQTFDVSADGIDRHFAVTHLAHFLLINRLLPLLRCSASTPPPLRRSPSMSPTPSRTSSRNRTPQTPRIVCLTSTLHAVSSRAVQFLSHAELSYESGSAQSPLALYARAKLATVLFVRALARHLDHDVLALAVDPGAVHPGQPGELFNAYGPLWGSALRALTSPFERTTSGASLTALWAATALRVEQGEEWERWQGAYVSAIGIAGGESEMTRDERREAQLWSMSEDLVRRRLGNDALRPWSG